MLNPIEIESAEDSNISWTKSEKSQDEVRISSIKLQTITPELSFILENDAVKFIFQ